MTKVNFDKERCWWDVKTYKEEEDMFDAEILPNGPGTRGRDGLIGVAEPK